MIVHSVAGECTIATVDWSCIIEMLVFVALELLYPVA